MSIVVTTPTGHVGSRVVRLLVQAGARPVVLARHPERLDPEVRRAVDVRQGDLGDGDFVRRATRDAEVLLWVDPTDFGAPDPEAETVRLGAVLTDAVVANAIPRVVFQSSVGAERRHGVGLVDGLARVEELLDAVAPSVLHLRCGYFFTNLLGSVEDLGRGVLRTAMRPDLPMPWVDPRDIGDIVAARLLSQHWSGRQVQAVHGPVDLTFTQVAATVAEAVARPVRLQVVSDDDECRQLLSAGMSATAATGVVDMTRGLRDGFRAEQPRTLITTTPTTLGEWAYAHLRPLVTTPATPAAAV